MTVKCVYVTVWQSKSVLVQLPITTGASSYKKKNQQNKTGFSEKKAEGQMLIRYFHLKRTSCTNEDALGRFRKRKYSNWYLRVVFTEHSKASSELTLLSCYLLI